MTDRPSPARVLVLGGPSGSGKSRWSAHLSHEHGWPIVRLDDYYRNGDDPTLPMLSGIPDWDDVRSWRCDDAVDALETLCRTGEVVAPVYDISASAVTGTQVVRLDPEVPIVIAEGIFAPYVIAPLRERGILEGAYCVHHNRWITFVRRLVRDLSEHRKPPMVLLRRGLRLARAEPRIVADQRQLGAEPIRPKELARRMRRRSHQPADEAR